jgi:hypothetical protein
MLSSQHILVCDPPSSVGSYSWCRNTTAVNGPPRNTLNVAQKVFSKGSSQLPANHNRYSDWLQVDGPSSSAVAGYATGLLPSPASGASHQLEDAHHFWQPNAAIPSNSLSSDTVRPLSWTQPPRISSPYPGFTHSQPPHMAIILNPNRSGHYRSELVPSPQDTTQPQSDSTVSAHPPSTNEETRTVAVPKSREKKHGCWMCHKSFDRPSTLRKVSVVVDFRECRILKLTILSASPRSHW